MNSKERGYCYPKEIKVVKKEVVMAQLTTPKLKLGFHAQTLNLRGQLKALHASQNREFVNIIFGRK